MTTICQVDKKFETFLLHFQKLYNMLHFPILENIPKNEKNILKIINNIFLILIYTLNTIIHFLLA